MINWSEDCLKQLLMFWHKPLYNIFLKNVFFCIWMRIKIYPKLSNKERIIIVHTRTNSTRNVLYSISVRSIELLAWGTMFWRKWRKCRLKEIKSFRLNSLVCACLFLYGDIDRKFVFLKKKIFRRINISNLNR